MKVIDPGKNYIGDYVADAQQFVVANNIAPSDAPDGESVVHVAQGKGGYARVYYDGKTEPINEEVFLQEVVYNFLPDRFKTYKPNG